MPPLGEESGKITPYIGTLPTIPEESVTPERVDSILGPGTFYLSQKDFKAITKMVREVFPEPTLMVGKASPELTPDEKS